MPRLRGPQARALFVLVVSLGLVLAGSGCDRRLEPFVPLEEEPAPVEGPVRVPGLESPVPQRGIPSAGAAGSIRGTVRIAAGVGRSGTGGVLFVIARSLAGGPPLAVRRLPPGPFPISFTLGPQDAMIPGRPLEGSVRLVARLDADGDPLTRQEDDLVAEVRDPVEPGDSAVELVLSRP